MKNVTINKINIFLFMVWMEVIIFVVSLIVSLYIIKPFSSLIIEKYNNFTLYEAIRISILFILISLLQILYKKILMRFWKINIKLLFFIINSSWLSLFLIQRIIGKTMLAKYSLIYIGIFLCFMLPYSTELKLLIKNKSIKN
ncbi:MAG: hypothetical protein K6357_02010 [Elusimicrobiota bacterium]